MAPLIAAAAVSACASSEVATLRVELYSALERHCKSQSWCNVQSGCCYTCLFSVSFSCRLQLLLNLPAAWKQQQCAPEVF